MKYVFFWGYQQQQQQKMEISVWNVILMKNQIYIIYFN